MRYPTDTNEMHTTIDQPRVWDNGLSFLQENWFILLKLRKHLLVSPKTVCPSMQACPVAKLGQNFLGRHPVIAIIPKGFNIWGFVPVKMSFLILHFGCPEHVEWTDTTGSFSQSIWKSVDLTFVLPKLPEHLSLLYTTLSIFSLYDWVLPDLFICFQYNLFTVSSFRIFHWLIETFTTLDWVTHPSCRLWYLE